MADARRLGEIAGPMLDRLHAQRERLSWVNESDEDRVVLFPTLVLRRQWSQLALVLCVGTYRLGVAWRRFA